MRNSELGTAEVAGLGLLGCGIVTSLVASGNYVVAWNRTPRHTRVAAEHELMWRKMIGRTSGTGATG